MTHAVFLQRVVEGQDLTAIEAGTVMEQLLKGELTDAQTGAFLTGLRMKGETVEEIAALARVMRTCGVPLQTGMADHLVDTCGTGGDGMQTFNISTTAAFVAAGAGVPVVKHGNRGVTSGCGSSDILQALGAEVNVAPEKAILLLKSCGFTFLFAPRYHPAMARVAKARSELGIRTVFNLLGPLANPARAKAQLVGVYHPRLVRPVAEVLQELGLSRAMVVHGNGLDEITTTGQTLVAELKDGSISEYRIDPGDLGISRAGIQSLKGGTISRNREILLDVITGREGPARDIVVMNAAAAIYLNRKASSHARGITLAEQSIDSGRADDVLHQYIAGSGGKA